MTRFVSREQGKHGLPTIGAHSRIKTYQVSAVKKEQEIANMAFLCARLRANQRDKRVTTRQSPEKQTFWTRNIYTSTPKHFSNRILYHSENKLALPSLVD